MRTATTSTGKALLWLCWVSSVVSFQGTTTVSAFGPTAGVVVAPSSAPQRLASAASSSLVRLQLSSAQNDNDNNEQTSQAVLALADFHCGTWRGKATSWAISADTAAGIGQRRTSPVFLSRMQLLSSPTGTSSSSSSSSSSSWQETLQWIDHEDTSGTDNNDKVVQESVRIVNFGTSHMDVDAQDASYSWDATLPDLPAALIGSTALQQFAVEHCLAVSDHDRARLWAVYSATDQSLLRVVVSHETRILDHNGNNSINNSSSNDNKRKNTLSAVDMMELQTDVDRLVDRIISRVPPPAGDTNADANSNYNNAPNATRSTAALSVADFESQIVLPSTAEDNANTSSSSINSNGLSPHGVSLLEISSGIWLGDAIIRDMTTVPATTSTTTGRGFDNKTEQTASTAAAKKSILFGSWTLGVQKVAFRWMWNFGIEIRQVVDAGKAMGVAMAVPAASTAGQVCVNEGLSRRIHKQDRMVYIDWDGDNVGFVVGSVSIQVG